MACHLCYIFIYLFISSYSAFVARSAAHQSPAVLHLNDHHRRTAEATSCREQPAFYNLPLFFPPKNICCSWRMEENVLISLSSSTQDSWFFCASVILLYLITIIMMTIYLICLFFYYSILWLSCSSPMKQRNIIIFNHVAASKSKCFSNIKSPWTWLIIFTLPQLQWGLD